MRWWTPCFAISERRRQRSIRSPAEISTPEPSVITAPWNDTLGTPISALSRAPQAPPKAASRGELTNVRDVTPVEGGLKAADLAVERRALVATLEAVGPDAPTLAGAWTAGDLAAHVAATEQSRGVPTFLGRTLVVRYGWRLNDTFRPIMAIDLRRFRRHGFDWALRRLERQPPGLLSRASLLPVSVFEIFVHHEDVRRPNDVPREAPIPDLAPCIEWLLRYHRRRLGHFGVRVVLPDGRELRGGGPGSALTIRGSADEIVLWLAGRPRATALTVTDDGGGALAVATHLGI